MPLNRTGYEASVEAFDGKRELIERDAGWIRANHPDAVTCTDFDDIPTSLDEMLEKLIEYNVRKYAQHVRMPIGLARKYMRQHLIEHPERYEEMKGALWSDYPFLVNLTLNGCRSFHISDNLSERMAHTEANVTTDMIRLPFPSFQLCFTSPIVHRLFRNLVENRNFMPDKADGAAAPHNPISVIACMIPESKSGGRTLALAAYEVEPGSERPILGLTTRQLLLTPGERMEDALRTDWNKIGQSAPGTGLRYGPEGLTEGVDDSNFYQAGIGFYRTVLNSILYLMSREADISKEKDARSEWLAEQGFESRSPHRKRQLTAQSTRFSRLPYSEVGGSVGPMVQRNADGHEVKADDTLIRQAVMVRGHWKNQAYGKDLLLRKMILVEPYTRYMEVGEVLDRPYVVTDTNRDLPSEDWLDGPAP